jgi:uncharacterized protein YndB with AHSA1/START domain/GNAT superfamily N-acetyltransferase
MDDPRLTFEIAIAAAPERVWDALVEPEWTRRYHFNTAVESDWAVGSPVVYRGGDGRAAAEGKVLEVEPGRRLVTTYRMLFDAEAAGERPFRVAWETAAEGAGSRLRVTLDGFEDAPRSYRLAAGGFEAMLKGLQYALEAENAPAVTLAGPPEIRPLSPALREDYLGFFDRDAFRDNPAWAECYCLFYQFAGSAAEWSARTAAENRAEVSGLIGGGQTQGYLAYVDGRPVGWCHATELRRLPGLEGRLEFAIVGDEKLGVIVCFVIAAPYRRKGIARALLDAACAGFRERGLAYAEAYPVKGPKSDASAYHGPLSMYLEAGFEPVREEGHYVVVRKALT